MPPSNDMTNQAQPYGSYGYPNMQPAYRQGPASHADASPTHDLYGQASYQQYSQVRPPFLRRVGWCFLITDSRINLQMKSK